MSTTHSPPTPALGTVFVTGGSSGLGAAVVAAVGADHQRLVGGALRHLEHLLVVVQVRFGEAAVLEGGDPLERILLDPCPAQPLDDGP